jgi:two-component system, NtrC family, nitrogen regulation response regulator NtrX
MFDIIVFSDTRNNIFLKKLSKHYEGICEFRNCFSILELKKTVKERFPDILLFLFDKTENKIDFNSIEQILNKYVTLIFILVLNDQTILEKQISSAKKFFLTTDFFQTNFEIILEFLFQNIQNNNRKNYGDYPYIINEIIGNSSLVKTLQKNIKKASDNKANILLTGELGNEYEDIAYLIHKNSNRKNFNFASCDLSLNPEEGLKTLFGFIENKNITGKSFLEYTFNGTIFIKNIHLLNKEDKERFISFLRSGSFLRLNSKHKLITNNKIITYIPKNAIESFLFDALNKEIFDRLSGKIVEVPSIKRRKEDFNLICKHLVKKICKEFHCKNQINEDFILKLAYFDWIGNMEELYFYLKLVIKNLLNNQTNNIEITAGDLFQTVYNKDLKNAKKEFETDYITKQLERFGGHITNTAKYIGMNRIALHKKIKDLKIKLPKE